MIPELDFDLTLKVQVFLVEPLFKAHPFYRPIMSIISKDCYSLIRGIVFTGNNIKQMTTKNDIPYQFITVVRRTDALTDQARLC